MRHPRMEKFAKSFPSLKEAEGLSPWEPYKLCQWGKSYGKGSTELNAVRFVLWIFNPQLLYPCGRFELWEAMLSFEDGDREAFAQWVKSPWWLLGR